MTKLKQSLSRLEAYINFEAPIIGFLQKLLDCCLHNYFFRYKNFVKEVEAYVKAENKISQSKSLLFFQNRQFNVNYISDKYSY